MMADPEVTRKRHEVFAAVSLCVKAYEVQGIPWQDLMECLQCLQKRWHDLDGTRELTEGERVDVTKDQQRLAAKLWPADDR